MARAMALSCVSPMSRADVDEVILAEIGIRLMTWIPSMILGMIWTWDVKPRDQRYRSVGDFEVFVREEVEVWPDILQRYEDLNQKATHHR